MRKNWEKGNLTPVKDFNGFSYVLNHTDCISSFPCSWYLTNKRKKEKKPPVSLNIKCWFLPINNRIRAHVSNEQIWTPSACCIIKKNNYYKKPPKRSKDICTVSFVLLGYKSIYRSSQHFGFESIYWRVSVHLKNPYIP